MDFDSLLSKYEAKACIVSVDFYEDESYGNIRILAGNKAHCDEMEMVQGRPFLPGTPYEFCFPQNRNFFLHHFPQNRVFFSATFPQNRIFFSDTFP